MHGAASFSLGGKNISSGLLPAAAAFVDSQKKEQQMNKPKQTKQTNTNENYEKTNFLLTIKF